MEEDVYFKLLTRESLEGDSLSNGREVYTKKFYVYESKLKGVGSYLYDSQQRGR